MVLKNGEFTILKNEMMDAIVAIMDDEIREKVHNEIAPCSNEFFLMRYIDIVPEFDDLLKSEFGIEIEKSLNDYRDYKDSVLQSLYTTTSDERDIISFVLRERGYHFNMSNWEK